MVSAGAAASELAASEEAAVLSAAEEAVEDAVEPQHGVVWHLDVGSSHPGAVVGPKGWAVRPLKRYASWVQNVVRQFGPYPLWA